MFKSFEIIAHVTFHAYETFGISKKYGFSKATVCTFIGDRFACLLEFCLLQMSAAILVTFVLQLTGKFLVLVVIILTPIIKFLVLYFYPRCILPIFADYKIFPEDNPDLVNLLARIKLLAKRVGFNAEKILIEETFDADLHSNATTSFDRIEISNQLLEHHKGHHEEILAILCHEFGHWKNKHLLKYLPIDTVYMILFSIVLTLLVNDVALLTSFGFKQESLPMSVFIVYWLVWKESFDYWLQFFYRYL